MCSLRTRNPNSSNKPARPTAPRKYPLQHHCPSHAHHHNTPVAAGLADNTSPAAVERRTLVAVDRNNPAEGDLVGSKIELAGCFDSSLGSRAGCRARRLGASGVGIEGVVRPVRGDG